MSDSLSAVDLKGKVAIVTGGGRGLGVHMAQHLAVAGAAVAVVGRSMQHLEENVATIRGAGGQAIAISADVTDRASIEQMVAAVTQELGAVDVLVNNAGVVGVAGPIWEADVDMWWQVMEVNLRGAMLCARAVLPSMVQRKKGVIINVASGAALGAIPYGSQYCVSKAALVRFTECLSADLQGQNVTAFAIDPGTVRTAMSEYLYESEEGKKWLPWFQGIFDEGRDVSPDLCAKLVTFLASGQANSLSGRFVSVFWNIQEMLQRAEQIQHDDLYVLRLPE